MEVTECTKIVLEKIQKFEPENATKIIGYLLLNHTHEEIMEYALGNEEQTLALINEAKLYLASSPKPIVPPPHHHAIARPFSSPSSFRVPAPYIGSPNALDFSRIFHNQQPELSNLDDHLQPINGNPFSLDYGVLRSGLRSPTSPVRPCYYYYQGNCRHGSSCKYYHGQSPRALYGLSSGELFCDERSYSPASLEQLDAKICELLRARDGAPLSIASLPSMYHEVYGRTLQADGYLTESQRHGKAGFSLTKLLARLNGIRILDRAHGQHAVVLAEDAHKYEFMNERSDSGATLSSSHQIYLTFPAESSFTDDDVLNYFQQFGPVRDVRIPRQEKRMFGFVSFYYPETVKTILSKGAPHHICGSRVLVKPYKEKSRLFDRRNADRAEFSMFFPPPYLEIEHDSLAMPRMYEQSPSSLLKKQLDEQELAFEIQRMRLLGLDIAPAPKPRPNHSYFSSFDFDDLSTPQDHFSPLQFAQDNNSGGSSRDEKPQDGSPLELQLPDSPFASPRLNNSSSNNNHPPGFGSNNNIYTVV